MSEKIDANTSLISHPARMSAMGGKRTLRTSSGALPNRVFADVRNGAVAQRRGDSTKPQVGFRLFICFAACDDRPGRRGGQCGILIPGHHMPLPCLTGTEQAD